MKKLKYKNFMKSITLIGFISFIACSHKQMTVQTPHHKGEINFGFDSDKIQSKYQAILKDQINYLSNNPQEILVIEGHTDYIGTKNYNDNLGDKRARSVKAYFVKNGIESNRLITVSYGESKAISKNNLPKNRRVVLQTPNQY